MLIGYARTSTVDQDAGLDAQVRDLKSLGCEKIFFEKVSSVGVRAELNHALDFAREGDTFVVTKLDRLARSVLHLLEIKERLTAKSVHLRILDMNIDTSTATGELMLSLLASIAQFERAMMLERQREGVAKAKREGRYLGRKSILADKTKHIQKLSQSGLTRIQIAKDLGISTRSVYRALASSE